MGMGGVGGERSPNSGSSAGTPGGRTLDPVPVGVSGLPMVGRDAGTNGNGARAPEPEVVGGCFAQLIANAGFEFGSDAWREVADTRNVIVRRDDPGLVAAGVSPQAGDYVAWLGGVPNGEYGQKYQSGLIQEVTIPAEALTLTLSGYAWVSQSELGLTPSDWAVLELDDPLVDEGAGALWQVRIWNEQDAASGWVYFETETVVLDTFKGRTVPLVADSRPDGNGTLNLWLDSLRLEARCPR